MAYLCRVSYHKYFFMIVEVFVGSSKDSLMLKANPKLTVNTVVAIRVWKVHEKSLFIFQKT